MDIFIGLAFMGGTASLLGGAAMFFSSFEHRLYQRGNALKRITGFVFMLMGFIVLGALEFF